MPGIKNDKTCPDEPQPTSPGKDICDVSCPGPNCPIGCNIIDETVDPISRQGIQQPETPPWVIGPTEVFCWTGAALALVGAIVLWRVWR